MKNLRIFIFLTGSLLVSCKSDPEVANEETAGKAQEIVITREQFQHNAMELGQLTEHDFPDVVRVSGEVEVPPENMAQINVFEGGFVKRIPLLEGSNVNQGQLILSLENPRYVELQQEFLELSGQLAYLKSEFERQKIMLEENITSKKNFLKVESEYKTGLARYNSLRRKLQMLNIDPEKLETGKVASQINIYAPISGTVNHVNVTKGMFVEPGFNIMEIVNTDHLHLKLQVFEKDIMKVKKGQKLLFTVPQAPSIIYEAEISLVGNSIDQNRMATVHAHLADSLKDNFAVGMFVEARIFTNTNLHKAVPEDAVVEVDNAHYVLTLEKKDGEAYVFTRRKITAKNNFNGYTALEDPEVIGGKQILTKGAFDLIGN